MRLYIQDYWTPYKDSDGSAVGTRVPLPYMEEYNEVSESIRYIPRKLPRTHTVTDLY